MTLPTAERVPKEEPQVEVEHPKKIVPTRAERALSEEATACSVQGNVLPPQMDNRAPREEHPPLEKESLPSTPWPEIQTMLEKPSCGSQSGREDVVVSHQWNLLELHALEHDIEPPRKGTPPGLRYSAHENPTAPSPS